MSTIAIGAQVSVSTCQPSSSTNEASSQQALPEPSPLGEFSMLTMAERMVALVMKSLKEQKSFAKTERLQARAEQEALENKQIEALRDKADHIAAGGYVSGALAIAGGAMTVASVAGGGAKEAQKPEGAATTSTGSSTPGSTPATRPTGAGAAGTSSNWNAILGKGGGAVSSLSDPAKQIVGEAPSARAEANAKAAELAANRARDRATDAKDWAGDIASMMQEAARVLTETQRTHNDTIMGIVRRM